MQKNIAFQSKQGLMVVIAALFIQLTLGIAYLWSLFQTGVTHLLFGGPNYQGQAALTFSIMLAFLTIGSVFGGILARKLDSTRIVVFIGGVILSLGFLLASFVTASAPWLLWLTYGFMGGVGMGFTYSTTIACAQKWYPHKKGLISGIIVSALGFGGVVFTPVIMVLLGHFGEPNPNVYDQIMGGEAWTFRILSIVFITICTLGSLFLKHPPTDIIHNAQCTAQVEEAVIENVECQQEEIVLIESSITDDEITLNPITAYQSSTVKKDFTAIEMLKNPKFYLIMFTFMLAVIGGQMIIAFMRPIEVLTGLDNALMVGGLALSIGVMAISACNSGGRLLWGFVCDKIGRINTILILLAASGILFLLTGLAIGSWVIFVVAALIGLCYGGILSTFPTLTADAFGTKNLATNYGFVLLGFGIGAIASSQIAGVFANRAVDYQNANYMYPAFIIGAACAAAGVGLMIVLKVLIKKQSK
ncbi:MAG: MFS transporter [Firmicutes bacterium]|nr:MFS transporter [Bacillota bacterium]